MENHVAPDQADGQARSLCPHCEPFIIEGERFSAGEIIGILEPCLTPERRVRIAEAVALRTYSVTPVMEGLYDRGNISAVLRSAEALGYQSVHIIESVQTFRKANRVTQGAEKWLDINVWPSTGECVSHLRALGYRIFATCVEGARPITELSFDQPAALFFGNEQDGVSDDLLGLANEHVVVPMLGLTQSVNISVAAALCLYHIYQDRCRRLGKHGDLSATERRNLTAEYYLRSVGKAHSILLEERQRTSQEK